MNIDFENEKQLLSENWLRMFGFWSKQILKQMYGDELEIKAKLEENEEEDGSFVVRGQHAHVKAYVEALELEKDYIIAVSDFGEEHPRAVKVMFHLEAAIAKFENLTGIKWPFK